MKKRKFDDITLQYSIEWSLSPEPNETEEVRRDTKHLACLVNEESLQDLDSAISVTFPGTKEKDGSRVAGVKPMKKKSPYYDFFKKVIDELSKRKKTKADDDEQELQPNVLYCPWFVDLLLKDYLPFVPLWSPMLLTNKFLAMSPEQPIAMWING